jgi:hypothetical protein
MKFKQILIMLKKIFSLTAPLLLLVINSIFGQMAELPLSQKLQQASDIFEGKVIHKTCFWNDQHSLIFTSNTIEIYKVFKGNIASAEVEIITDGGQIDNEIQNSDANLELAEGGMGIFFTEPSKISKHQKLAFKVYGNSQGFIKYDPTTNSATDAFKKYDNIQNDVYKVIEKHTNHPYKEIKVFSTLQSNETISKKKKCCFKTCKKKDKK